MLVRLAVAAVEEAVVLALPLLVIQPPLQLGDCRVECVVMVVLPPIPTGIGPGGGGSGGWEALGVELETAGVAAAVGLDARGVGGEDEQQDEGKCHVEE
uniref:Secreted protein n=1 Tax=Arundo donax TaxID=35708 RepID=A0A0A9E760_ARUDO